MADIRITASAMQAIHANVTVLMASDVRVDLSERHADAKWREIRDRACRMEVCVSCVIGWLRQKHVW